MNAARSRWPRSWISRSTIPTSATTPAPPNVLAARAIFLPASTSARCSASCSKSSSPRWRDFSDCRHSSTADVRSRRSRRRQRPAVGRHPARARTARIPPSTTRSAFIWSKPAPTRARGAAPTRLATSPSGSRPRPAVAAGLVRRRAVRQRAARRAAGASGRDARRRAARGLRRRRRATGELTTRRGPARRRRRSPTTSTGSASTLEPGWRVEDQPARGRLDPRRRAPAAARLHHPDRLRARRARAVLGDALRRHADDLRAAHDRRARSGRRTRRPGCSSPGEQDITAHVDFTSVRAGRRSRRLTTLGFLDQTYFLLGLLEGLADPQSAIRNPH